MRDQKPHADAVPFAIRAAGKGFALQIRQFFDDRAARRVRRQAERELDMLPPELQCDVGWRGRRTHDGS